MSEVDLSEVEVLPNLPNYFRPCDGDPLPDDLTGATIIQFGAVAESRAVPGGGLVIDYQKPGDAVRRRIVLGFNDIAMWAVAPTSPIPSATSG